MPNGGTIPFSFFFTIDFVQRFSLSWLAPHDQSNVLPWSKEVGAGCISAGMSEMPVEGLKSTSEEMLLLGLRFGLADTGDDVVEFVGKGSGDDSEYEDGNAWWEVLALSGVTVGSRFNRASRRALSFKAR